MMKHRALRFMLVIPLLGGLASCNPDSSSSQGTVPGSSQSNSSQGGTNSSSASADVGTIQFWHTCGQTVETELTMAAEEFEALVAENEGVNLTINLSYKGSYDDQLSQIRSAFSIGEQPTLAIAYPDHVSEYLASETTVGQFVVDLDQYIESDEYGFGCESYLGDGPSSDFVKAYFDEGSSYIREGTYSIPLMKSTEVMFYNIDAVLPHAYAYTEQEVQSPNILNDWLESLSFSELMDFCRYIKENDSNFSTAGRWPCFYDSDSNLYITQSMQKNIPFISYGDNGMGSIDFNNAQAKEMVTEVKGWYDEGLLMTRGVNGVYGSNHFTAGGCYFDIGSSGGAGYNEPTGGLFDVGVCRVPAFNKENPVYVNQGLTATILKARDDNDGRKALYAFKFLKHLTSTSKNTTICVNGSEGYVPVRESCYETDLFKRFTSTGEMMGTVASIVTGEIAGQYYNTPCFPGSAYARDAVGGIISQVLSGATTLDNAFSEAENNAKNQLRNTL